jgi:hypothetical protein
MGFLVIIGISIGVIMFMVGILLWVFIKEDAYMVREEITYSDHYNDYNDYYNDETPPGNYSQVPTDETYPPAKTPMMADVLSTLVYSGGDDPLDEVFWTLHAFTDFANAKFGLELDAPSKELYEQGEDAKGNKVFDDKLKELSDAFDNLK